MKSKIRSFLHSSSTEDTLLKSGLFVLVLLFISKFSILLFVSVVVMISWWVHFQWRREFLHHERNFYASRGAGKKTKSVVTVSAAWAAIVAAIVSSVFACFAFRGLYSERVWVTSGCLLIVILILIAALCALSQRLSYDPVKWGLLKLSIACGLAFSLLSSVCANFFGIKYEKFYENLYRERTTYWERFGDKVSSLRAAVAGSPENVLEQRRELITSIEDLIEFVNYVGFVIDDVIFKALSSVFPGWLATLINFILSVDVIYGVPIVTVGMFCFQIFGDHSFHQRIPDECDS